MVELSAKSIPDKTDRQNTQMSAASSHGLIEKRDSATVVATSARIAITIKMTATTYQQQQSLSDSPIMNQPRANQQQ